MSDLQPALPALDVCNLHHRYGDRDVLGSVSFRVEAGEIFALLGPNGSGKSTLFRILTTLMTPTSGTARVFGADVLTDPAGVRRSIGVVFQSPALDPQLTARENLYHHGQLYGIEPRELRSRIDAALVSAQLAPRAHDRVGTFSGGMKRRLEIAKATLPRPKLLLLDEPDTGLDVAARAHLKQSLHLLATQQGITSLLTTHQMDLADTCDRVALLDEGKIVAMDTPEVLTRQVGGQVILLSVDDIDNARSMLARACPDIEPRVLEGRIVIESAQPVELLPRVLASLDGRVKALEMHRPTLEDVFLRLTGRRLANKD